MHDIDTALELIRARDATAATLAKGMWELMRSSAPHPRVTQYDVQRMVWGAVPYALRHPLGPERLADRHDISRAFADLLDLMGYPRYAELCRGRMTRDILDAAEDGERCAELVAKAWAASGVDPPDTPIVTWLPYRGPVEEALHGTAGRLLEDAIEAGILMPGMPEADDLRVELTMRMLTSPDDETGDTWFVRLLDERLDSWIMGAGRSPTRRELLARLRPDIRNTPDISSARLPGLQHLLEACRGPGVKMTPHGYLPTALVAELAEIMPLCRENPRPGRGERSWPPIRWMRELVTQWSMVRPHRGRLRLTEFGKHLVDDPDSLLMCVGERLVTYLQSPLGMLEEIMLAALLLEDHVDPDSMIDKMAWALEEHRYADEDGEPFTRDHAVTGANFFVHKLRTLDAVDFRESPERLGLTEAGRAMARWALRARVMLREVSG